MLIAIARTANGHGIEATLRQAVPQIMAVDVVSDRAVPVREFTDVLASASFKPLT